MYPRTHQSIIYLSSTHPSSTHPSMDNLDGFPHLALTLKEGSEAALAGPNSGSSWELTIMESVGPENPKPGPRPETMAAHTVGYGRQDPAGDGAPGTCQLPGGGVQRRTSPGLAQPAGPWGFAFYHLRRSQELTHSCWLLFSHSVLAALCDPMDCSPARLLHPWDSPGKNTGGGCHALLQGIFPTKGLNWHLSVSYAGRQILPLAPPEKSKWNISQHKKGHLWQTHIICNSVNLKAFPLKSGIK